MLRRGIRNSDLASGLRWASSFTSRRAAKTAPREAAKHYEENMKMFGELRLVRALTDEQIAAMRDPRIAAATKLPSVKDAVKAAAS